MKRVISILLSVLLLAMTCIVTVATEPAVNLLQTHLASKTGILMNVSNGQVTANDRFDSQGAFAIINDGDKTVTRDVYGALDWSPARYVGVLFTLSEPCDVTSVAVTSGYSNLADTYRVYAGDSLETLYTAENMVGSNLVCAGDTQTAAVNGTVQYVAVFLTDYTYNGRIREVEVFGAPAPTDPTKPTASDYAAGLTVAGTYLMMGEKAVALRGANIPQYSWSADGDGGDSATALLAAINWNCTIVRLAVNPDLYLNGGTGKNGASVSAADFRKDIDDYITALTSRNIAVVLDCHAYAGAYSDVTQFWQIVAPLYDDNELVIYDLLNEPISDWQTWYEGGTVTLPDGNGTQAQSVGMIALLDLVRGYSDNVVAIGGIDWAFDLSGIASGAFSALASERASALGMTEQAYREAYSLSTASRQGRGIMLSTHIYSNKPLNWDAAIGAAAQEYPILVGEYNPYYRGGYISELDAKEKAFYQRIFRFMNEGGFSSTAWSLGAEPFLINHNGNISALGYAVKSYIENGVWECDQPENLIAEQYDSVRSIYRRGSNGTVRYNNTFINQAYKDGAAVGNGIIGALIDGDTGTHYDVYEWEGYLTGLQYSLLDTFAAYELRLSSGLSGYPDRYQIYASDSLDTLYSATNCIENMTVDHEGTVTYTIDRPVRYVAFLASGYVRIKEIALSGVPIGDLDGDYTLDSSDLALLTQQLLGNEPIGFTARSDTDKSGAVNILDLIILKKKLA